MRNLISYGVVFILLFIIQIGYSQSIDSPYEVGTWQGFRSGAVSFTFDDGCSNQFSVALPMFNQYGYKLTLFTVVNGIYGSTNWTALQTAANQGHEIASHTVTHTNFSSISDSLEDVELKNSKIAIESHITGQKCVTMAYPYCATGNTAICNQYYIAARGCSGQVEPGTPSNFMNISSIVCGDQGPVQTPQNFKEKADASASSHGWVVFLLHGIDNDGGYSPVTTANLQGALDSLHAYPNKYWISSFGNVARYIRERNCVSVKEKASTDSLITLSVTDTLDKSIFNYPITIRRPLPQTWTSALISRNNEMIETQVIDINTVKYMMFDVVPDTGDITIKKSDVTSVSRSYNFLPLNPHLMQNYPNPFNPSTVIKYVLQESTDVTLKMYTLYGQEVETLANGYQSAGEHEIQWQPQGLASGIYFYRLQVGSFSDTRKLVLLR